MKQGYYLKGEAANKDYCIYLGNTAPSAGHNLNDTIECLYEIDRDVRSGVNWWVDYCAGLDVNGEPAWYNIDQTPALERYV